MSTEFEAMTRADESDAERALVKRYLDQQKINVIAKRILQKKRQMEQEGATDVEPEGELGDLFNEAKQILGSE